MERRYLMAFGKQPFRQGKPDVARAAGDEDFARGHRYSLFRIAIL